MANIGPLVAKITANAEGVSGGVNDAVARLEKGAGAIGAAGKKAGDAAGGGMLSGLKSGLAGIGGAIGSALDAAAGVAKVGAIGIGAVLAGGIAGYVAQTDKIKALGKGSLLSGFGTEDLQTLSVLTGNLDLATSTATKFQAAIADAVAGGGDNAFSRLGIDAAALAGKPLQAFGAFADGVNKLGTQFEKLSMAERVFGDGAADMLGAIERGSAGIAKARTQMDAFGATIGPGMVAMAKQAEIATRTIGLFKDGILNQVTIGAGAILAELGDRFGTLGISWKSLGKTIVDVAESIAQAGAWMMDAWANPSSAWGDALKFLEVGLLRAVAVFADGMEQAVLSSGNLAQNIFGSKLGAFISVGVAGAKYTAGATDGQSLGAGARSSADKLMEELAQSRATRGADRGVGQFFDNVRSRIENIGKIANENNPAAIWMASAKEWEVGNKTSFEALFERINKAKYLLDPANGPGLSAMGRGRLGTSLFDSLKQFMPTYTPVGAMERGSREAYSAVQEYRGVGSQNIQEGIKAAIEEANRQQREQIRVAEATLDAIRDGGVIAVKGMN